MKVLRCSVYNYPILTQAAQDILHVMSSSLLLRLTSSCTKMLHLPENEAKLLDHYENVEKITVASIFQRTLKCIRLM